MVYDIKTIVKPLLEKIQLAYVEKDATVDSFFNGRFPTGRFCRGNACAEKLLPNDEDIYLLYLICGNMQEIADLLGVCRQTVAKRIKQYKLKMNF